MVIKNSYKIMGFFMKNEYMFKEYVDIDIFKKIGVILLKYLGKLSQMLIDRIMYIISTILERCNYLCILGLAPEPEKGCNNCAYCRTYSHIEKRKRIKYFDKQLLVELTNILQEYIGKFSKSLATAIFEIIVAILDIYGYKQKVIK
jgi:hypothetical protein